MLVSILSGLLAVCASMTVASTAPAKYKILSAKIDQSEYAQEAFDIKILATSNTTFTTDCSLNWPANTADEDRGDPVHEDFACSNQALQVSMSRLNTDPGRGFEIYIQMKDATEAQWTLGDLSTVPGWTHNASSASFQDGRPFLVVNQWIYAGGAIVSGV